MSPLSRINWLSGGSTSLPVEEDVWMKMVHEQNSIKYFLDSPIPGAVVELIAGIHDQVKSIDFILDKNTSGDLYVNELKMISNVIGVTLP